MSKGQIFYICIGKDVDRCFLLGPFETEQAAVAAYPTMRSRAFDRGYVDLAFYRDIYVAAVPAGCPCKAILNQSISS